MYCARPTDAQTISESVIHKRLEYWCCQRRAVLALSIGAGRKETGDWPFRLESDLDSEIVMLA